MKADPIQAETDRVYAEYAEARAEWEKSRASGPVDPFVKSRFDRAQQALRDLRQTWREIGTVAGNRDTFIGSVDNHDGPLTLTTGG